MTKSHPKQKRAPTNSVSAQQTDNRKKNGTSNIVPLPSFLTLACSPRSIVVTGCLFFMVATGVFFASNYFSLKTATGFPDFQDYKIDLVDQNNTPQTVENFIGQPLLLFFGFTYCPDVCPTTLSIIAAARDDLDAAGVNTDPLRIVFVTVDPIRDTPEQMREYLSLFDIEVTGLTGTMANVTGLLKQFGIYAKKIDQSEGDYLFDHSAAVFLYRADGRFKGTIVHNEPFSFIKEKIKSIL